MDGDAVSDKIIEKGSERSDCDRLMAELSEAIISEMSSSTRRGASRSSLQSLK